MNKGENPDDSGMIFWKIPDEPTARRHFFNVELMKGTNLPAQMRVLMESTEQSFDTPECQTVDQLLGKEKDAFLDRGFEGLSDKTITTIFSNVHLWMELNFLALSEGNDKFWNMIQNEAFPELKIRSNSVSERIRMRIQTGLNRDDLN